MRRPHEGVFFMVSSPMGPVDPYPLLDLGELVALKLPPREAVIEGLIYCRSIVRLGAREKSGKSLMGVDMACSVVLGEEFLGRPTRRGPVALIPLEEQIAEIRQRI